MPFDEGKHDHDGGGGDPHHDPEGLSAAVEGGLMSMTLTAEMWRVCTTCAGIALIHRMCRDLIKETGDDRRFRPEHALATASLLRELSDQMRTEATVAIAKREGPAS